MSLFSRVSFADFEQANFCWEKPWKMLSFADSHVKTLKWSHSFSQNWTAFIHRFLVGLRETASHYGRISCVLTGAMSLKQFQGFQGKIFATVNCAYSSKSFLDKKRFFLKSDYYLPPSPKKKKLFASMIALPKWWKMFFIVSATLSGAETLKYPSFHGIYYFDKIFCFFTLVSDFW